MVREVTLAFALNQIPLALEGNDQHPSPPIPP